ncbi:MAG: hypothetical protein LUD12_11180 [Lachnospiraceae bacterium]|nr:hypothetical protein [Lachnospiraceae bacterium]
MPGIVIDINKTEDNNKKTSINTEDQIHDMMEQISNLCESLFVENDRFDRADFFWKLKEYLAEYDRILYAPISNIIYNCYNENDEGVAEKQIGTVISNLEAVVAYVYTSECLEAKNMGSGEKAYEDSKKAVLKIWDHINLAKQQYMALKQSDEEYKKKFTANIEPIKEGISKDLNSQLLSIVSIFTALAFLIFGGISSLDNILANQGIPLFKLIIIGAVWGLCILNLIFVFLFCIGKMTKLNFKSTDDENATIFQKYPIVWWTNLIIVSMILAGIWGYYLTKKGIYTWFDNICYESPVLTTLIGTLLISLVITLIAWKLLKETRYSKDNEN